jgi:hypothetical protein
MENITISQNRLIVYGIAAVVATALITVCLTKGSEKVQGADGRTTRRFRKWWKTFGSGSKPEFGKQGDVPMYSANGETEGKMNCNAEKI